MTRAALWASWIRRVLARTGKQGGADAGAPARPLPTHAGPDPALEAFAASVVHTLRTPLSALSGEVELALRRERSRTDYQETLARIGLRVAELVDMTADLGFLGQLGHASPASGSVALDAVLARLEERFGVRRGMPVLFAADMPRVHVAGDERLLTGALALLLEVAVKHRRGGAPVRLQAAPAQESAADLDPASRRSASDGRAQPAGSQPQRWIEVRIEAAPGSLARYSTFEPSAPMSPSQVAFQAAAGIIVASGGSVAPIPPGFDAIGMRLRQVPAPQTGSESPARMIR